MAENTSDADLAIGPARSATPDVQVDGQDAEEHDRIEVAVQRVKERVEDLRCGEITETVPPQQPTDRVAFGVGDPPRHRGVLFGWLRPRRQHERSRPGLRRSRSTHLHSLLFGSALLRDISCKSAKTLPCVSINSYAAASN
ncbi:MAG: hypothetical protein S0880_35140 [Actinomycetota bacterium]|nr:hypothetical protein [Actinomycetota bacterium]